MFEFLDDPGLLIPYALVQAFIFILLLRAVDLYEREPLSVVAVMAMWGAIATPVLALALDEPIRSFLPEGNEIARAMSAALVEEPVKGIALLAAFGFSYLFARRFGWLEFEGVTDGIVYGAAVGLGFAFTEDVFYLIRQETTAAGIQEFASRADFLGISMMGHAVYTGAFGAGLGLATWDRTWTGRIGFPLIGMGLGVSMHATHNGLTAAGSIAATRGADFLFLCLFVAAVVLWLRHQQLVIHRKLGEEMEAGLITPEERDRASHFIQRMKSHLQLARQGRMDQLAVSREVDEELAELAFAKWRLERLGTRGAWRPVERTRERVRRLKSELAETHA